MAVIGENLIPKENLVLFNQHYREGEFSPKRGGEHNWHVWCCTGALEVLRSREYITYLAEHPDVAYTINFANSSSARIQPGHPLWEVLADVARSYSVQVFQLTLQGGYSSWTGAPSDLYAFDCISIKAKSSDEQRATVAIGDKGIAQIGSTADCEDGGILRL
jgi:hypothetical protein